MVNSYGTWGYGLYIPEDALEGYLASAPTQEDETGEEIDAATQIGLCTVSDCEGEATRIANPGNKNNVEESFPLDNSCFYFAPLKTYPSLFNQAYADYEAALTELKTKYSKYLPEDFDYEANFVYYVGTCCG